MGPLSVCHLLFVCLSLTSVLMTRAADYTLTMESETSCSKTHYYKRGDKFKASANGAVFDGMCPLTFIQTGSLHGDPYVEPCLSLCIHIVSYTMDGCQVKMAYYDGLTDYSPAEFDCHTFPPVMWCSSKNELKITVSELEKYDNEKYAITFEVTPFCGTEDRFTTDNSVVSQPHRKKTSMSQTALIVGAIVGTVSILFVLAWLIYCIRKRHLELSAENSDQRTDRSARGGTPCQPVNRYAPIENRNKSSSQSSSDRGMVAKQPPDSGVQNINNLGERRLYSPFQPPSQRGIGTQQPQQHVLYSDLDRGPGGEKWHPGGSTTGKVSNIDPYPPPSRFGPPTSQNQPQSQYMLQNQVYKYPQFNNTDGEMHTHPTDTRFVVYDFDYEQPVERKYSAGKIRTTPHRDSPSKDMDRQRQREITPLRETVRVMPSIEGGHTDQTSDNDSESFSGTTGDDTETDDAMPRYTLGPPFGFFNQPRHDPGTQVVYDPRNFQRVDSKTSNKSEEPLKSVPAVPSRPDMRTEIGPITDSSNVTGASVDPGHSQAEEKEGPVPQVPPIPKDFQRTQMSSPTADLPWPHGPPPPYSPGTTDKFVV